MVQTASRMGSRTLLFGGAIVVSLMVGACGVPAASQSSGTPVGSGAQPTGTPVASGAQTGGSLTFGLANEPDTLDPGAANTASAHVVFMPIFDTLVWLDPTSREFKPGLAESWSANADGTAYTFKVRPGVKFQDGTDLDATAVKFSFDRILDPNFKAGQARAKLGPLEAVKVIDAHTVEFDLKSPFPSLLDSLSQSWLGIVSPTAVQKWGADFGKHPVGTGSYSFGEWALGEHITIKKNAEYGWAPPFMTNQGPGYLDDITFRIIPDNGARTAALESGDLSAIQNVPEADFGRLKSAGAFQMVYAPWPGMPRGITMNTERAPTDDIAVRRAIMYGLSRKDFIDTAVFGIYQPAEGPLSPNMPDYTTKVEGIYPYDPQKAMALLEEAGWKLGSGGIREKDGKPLTLLLLTHPQFKPMAIAIQGLLKPLGFDVQVDIRDLAAAFAASHAGEANMGFSGTIDSNAAGGMDLWFHSKNYGSFNWARVKDPKIDELLDKQSVETDPAAQKLLIEELQLRIMDLAINDPLFQGGWLYGISPKVQGFRTNALAYPYFNEMSIAR